MGGTCSRLGSDDFSNKKKQSNLRFVNRFFNQVIGEDRQLNARIAFRHVLTGQPRELLKLLAKVPDIFFSFLS